jgi:hypothetical protein
MIGRTDGSTRMITQKAATLALAVVQLLRSLAAAPFMAILRQDTTPYA